MRMFTFSDDGRPLTKTINIQFEYEHGNSSYFVIATLTRNSATAAEAYGIYDWSESLIHEYEPAIEKIILINEDMASELDVTNMMTPKFMQDLELEIEQKYAAETHAW